jgi:hypothetical protein
LQENSDDVTLL